MTERVYYRKVDQLGRVVIPSHLREAVGITSGTEVSVRMEGNEIIIYPKLKGIRCDYTGKFSDDVELIGNGVYLSKEGKERLLERLSGGQQKE